MQRKIRASLTSYTISSITWSMLMVDLLADTILTYLITVLAPAKQLLILPLFIVASYFHSNSQLFQRKKVISIHTH